MSRCVLDAFLAPPSQYWSIFLASFSGFIGFVNGVEDPSERHVMVGRIACKYSAEYSVVRE